MTERKKPRQPRKRTGGLSISHISVGADGGSVTNLPVDFPTDKEGIERMIAEAFQRQFNEALPLGPSVRIDNLQQKDTSDLDFQISCSIADYLELAEVAPLSEPFGREAIESGLYRYHQFAEWIYRAIIANKQTKYGDLARRVFLLLFTTTNEFMLPELHEAIASFCHYRGSRFAAVGLMTPLEGASGIMQIADPYRAGPLPTPWSFYYRKAQMLKPVGAPGGAQMVPFDGAASIKL